MLENIQNIMQHVEEGIRYKYASVKDDHANAKKCLLISDSHNALASQALIDVAEHTENLGLAATDLAQLHQKLLALGPNFGLISKAAPEQHFTQ
ncbi:MAG: hypothetical protein R3D66_00380 [Alphaproteobacteria bacterium]